MAMASFHENDIDEPALLQLIDRQAGRLAFRSEHPSPSVRCDGARRAEDGHERYYPAVGRELRELLESQGRCRNHATIQ